MCLDSIQGDPFECDSFECDSCERVQTELMDGRRMVSAAQEKEAVATQKMRQLEAELDAAKFKVCRFLSAFVTQIFRLSACSLRSVPAAMKLYLGLFRDQI